MTRHDQTRPDISGHKRTQADMVGHEAGRRPDASSTDKVRDLEDQILILKTDLKWRDQVISEQKQANQIFLDEVKGQSRYIGHIETKLMKLGGTTNQAFLEAPVPKSGRSEGDEVKTEVRNPEVIENMSPHPDQANLYSG